MNRDEYERATAARRPSNWQERPDGPDRFDWMALEMTRLGSPTTRAAILATLDGSVVTPLSVHVSFSGDGEEQARALVARPLRAPADD